MGQEVSFRSGRVWCIVVARSQTFKKEDSRKNHTVGQKKSRNNDTSRVWSEIRTMLQLLVVQMPHT